MSDGRPLDLWLCEQVEAIAIAIAMALVLKFFVVEAYQIPTGSMQPMLLGDAATGNMDRVLADKLCTMFRDPRRWEVMIFRFPSDERRLYIKRIVGLPGETLEVKGGDLWIDGRIARKPDRLDDAVLKEIYPVKDGGMDVGRAFVAGDGVEITPAGVRFAPGASGDLRLRNTVRDDYLHGYDPDWRIQPAPVTHGTTAVPDLELAADVTLSSADGEAAVTFLSDEGELRVAVGAERGGAGSPVTLTFTPAAGGAPVALAQGAAPPGAGPAEGRTSRLVARSVDRQVVVLLDGEEALRWTDDASGPRSDEPTRALVSLALRGGGLADDLVVRRDIHYLPAHDGTARWQIPEQHYFAMGDNTQASHDSRTWQRMTFVTDEREVTGFWFYNTTAVDRNPRHDGNTLVYADLHGDEYRIDPSRIEERRLDAAPFIHERYLLGKAFAVFWPFPPFGPFRWKLIH